MSGLRGVSRHQDRIGIGNALTLKEQQEDMDIVLELGANTLRLAHYQHAQAFYDLCDEKGIIVWTEIPYIAKHMSAGRKNAQDQMRELMKNPATAAIVGRIMAKASASRGEVAESTRGNAAEHTEKITAVLSIMD